MSPALCERIEAIMAKERGVIRTGRGGDQSHDGGLQVRATSVNTGRPFVYAVWT